jgi:hypothetical protein
VQDLVVQSHNVKDVMNSKNRLLSIAAVAALGFTLASCAGGEGDENTAPDAGSGSTTEQTEAAESEAATTDEAAATGAECLIGTWEMTPEAAEAQALAALGGEGEITVEGTSTVTFDAETYTLTSDVSSTFDVTMEGTPIQGTTTTQGSYVMGYTADDTTVTFGDVVSADGAIVTDMGAGPTEIDFATSAEAATGLSQTYTCTDTELTMVSSVGGVELEQVYTRA